MAAAFRRTKYEVMFWPLILYYAVDGGFSFYLIYLTKINAFDWLKPPKDLDHALVLYDHKRIII